MSGNASASFALLGVRTAFRPIHPRRHRSARVASPTVRIDLASRTKRVIVATKNNAVGADDDNSNSGMENSDFDAERYDAERLSKDAEAMSEMMEVAAKAAMAAGEDEAAEQALEARGAWKVRLRVSINALSHHRSISSLFFSRPLYRSVLFRSLRASSLTTTQPTLSPLPLSS